MTPTGEMREQIRPGVPIDQRGNIHLRYDHYIDGLRLEGTETVVHIRADGQIYAITADIAPISPRLVQTVNRPTVSDPQVRLIVKRDLQAAGVDPRAVTHLELEKFAIAVPPYVLWKAGVAGRGGGFLVSCDYTMDAFSGQILEKMSAVRWVKPPTPEDRVGCPPTGRK